MVWKSKPQPTKQKPRVTILIGILGRHGIVLASDSQTSFEASKRRDTEKIRVVRFKDKSALVSAAGSSDVADQVIDTLCRYAEAEKLDDEAKVASIMQRAMMYVREGLRSHHGGCSAEELRNILIQDGIECDFMMAFHCKGSPRLYCLKLQNGTLEIGQINL